MASNDKSLEQFFEFVESVGESVTADQQRNGGSKTDRTIRFRNGQSARLDPADSRAGVWADVLGALRERERPAYIEVDSQSRIIVRLLVPTEQPVAAIRPSQDDNDIIVEFHNSHAIHHIKQNVKGHVAMLQLLRDAQKSGEVLWITETPDDHEIIDVRRRTTVMP